FTDPPSTEISTLSLHDALPIYRQALQAIRAFARSGRTMPTSESAASTTWLPSFVNVAPSFGKDRRTVSTMCGRSSSKISMALFRSEEHTSELQSRSDLVCRLLL